MNAREKLNLLSILDGTKNPTAPRIHPTWAAGLVLLTVNFLRSAVGPHRSGLSSEVVQR